MTQRSPHDGLHRPRPKRARAEPGSARGKSSSAPDFGFGKHRDRHALCIEVQRENRRSAMKTLLVATALTAALVAATPASAQFYAGAGPGGVGVEVGPFGVGVGPRYGWRDGPYTNGYYAYGSDCRVV